MFGSGVEMGHWRGPLRQFVEMDRLSRFVFFMDYIFIIAPSST